MENKQPTIEEFLTKEIGYILQRNQNEKFLRILLTRALILEDTIRNIKE